MSLHCWEKLGGPSGAMALLTLLEKNPILNNSTSFTGTVIFRPVNVTDLWQEQSFSAVYQESTH